ncbi:MAG TPA: choice-of-anchor R domain-containing protein [Thermoanaerobaculia bacterium]|nr:choice-of-anchor R domain-containing protein [Thermoanaerobaculia bacterium]
MSRSVRIASTVVLVVVALLVARPLAGQVVLISNLPGNDGSQSADLNQTRNKGMGFTMPAGDDYVLDFVTLRLETFGAVAPIVELWTDAAGLPGVPIETLTNPTFEPSGIANYDFASSGTTLVAGESYWLVAYGAAGAARYDWKASSPAQTPTGLATHLGAVFDTNGPPPTNTSSILTSYSLTAMVFDTMPFIDGFESGDTSAWSFVAP